LPPKKGKEVRISRGLKEGEPCCRRTGKAGEVASRNRKRSLMMIEYERKNIVSQKMPRRRHKKTGAAGMGVISCERE